MKAVQARGVTIRAPPVGCLESRTATAGPVRATSTQLDLSLLRLLAEATGESSEDSDALQEIISVLGTFEGDGTITPRGIALLEWARP